MKIQVFSDIHVDCRADKTFQIPYSNSDLVVLAGDIGEGLLGITWAADQSQRLGKPVVYVAGNHEYYYRDITRHDDAMRRHAEQLEVVFLNRDVFEYRGVRVIGATLWTSFRDQNGKDDWFAMHKAK
ncbi:MAG: metallophosphoesterase family protein, partial [Marinobacter sp.]|nr:metallophosphoesterase family protein [Marinobacter sp.]